MLPIYCRGHRAPTPTRYLRRRHRTSLRLLLRELSDWQLSALLVMSLLLTTIRILHLLLSMLLLLLLCHLRRSAILLGHALLLLLYRLAISAISEIKRLR